MNILKSTEFYTIYKINFMVRFPGGSDGRKIPWRRAWLPTPILPGEFLGQRSLQGYGAWVVKSWTRAHN